MKISLKSWQKAALVAAAALLSVSCFALDGFSGNAAGKPEAVAASTVPAAASKSTAALKPGEAVVHRGPDVKYTVPEGVSILMYHMIGNQSGNAAIMSEANLRIQMNYLRDHGYHPITMKELYDYVTKGAPLPEKPVCITFDDGYLDSYTVVYTLMKE